MSRNLHKREEDKPSKSDVDLVKLEAVGEAMVDQVPPGEEALGSTIVLIADPTA